MAHETRRSFVGSAVAAGAVVVLGARRGRAPGRVDEMRIDCGFKADASELAYGRTVREQLYREALRADFDAMAGVMERIAATVDRTRIHELWLHVSGSVDGKYRSRQFVIEL